MRFNKIQHKNSKQNEKKKIFFIILNLHILKYFSEQMNVVIGGISHVQHSHPFPELAHSFI